MRTPGKPRDAVTIETPRDTAARHASGYVTERERRALAMIESRAAELVTPAQAAFAANVRAVLVARGGR